MKNEIAPKPSNESIESTKRRKFFGALVASSIGFGMASSEKNCDDDCICDSCSYDRAQFGVSPAYAYERDVGDDTRSADSAAQNKQARETNDRLEQRGFKLDTKEEEQARLNDAFASFSYDDINGAKSKSNGSKNSSRSGYNKAKQM